MNPIASFAMPAAPRPGAAERAVEPVAPLSGVNSAGGHTGSPGTLTPQAVAPAAAQSGADQTARRAVSDEAAATRASGSADSNAAEEAPETGARPVPPLKSFAQIPTRMMEEINKLREEAAEAESRGVPGRDDPTPMPANSRAIGGASEAPHEPTRTAS